MTTPKQQLEWITQGYLEAMLWAEHDDEGQPLDDRFQPGDVADESVKAIVKDIETFIECAETLGILHIIDAGYFVGENRWGDYLSSLGHDIHLTRNGHGTGFWDRGYAKEDGEALTKLAAELGTAYPWAEGDRVYVERG